MNDPKTSGAPGRRYCVISPCRDEEAYMRRTLDSVAAQTCPPTLWVVVDDGSTDGTPGILAEYAAKLPYLRIVRRVDRGRRSVGPGVIDAFYAGLETVDLAEFDYLCKLDLDLDLPPGYFEGLMRRMEANPRLGTCSGKAYFIEPRRGARVSEGIGDEMSVGMTKFYRTRCFQQIGGFVREVMWDGIDCHRCRMQGWMAQSWDDEELRFLHLRPMGSSDQSILTGRVRHGFGQYFMGTAPLYMLASVVFRMAKRPWLVGGMAMGWGYLWSLLRRRPRYPDLEFRGFLRRYQRSCLWRGKRKATDLEDRKGVSRWNPEARPSTPNPSAERRLPQGPAVG